MSPARRAWIEHAVCGRKVACGRAAAMRIGTRARAKGERLSAYRCPFHIDGWEEHWHVGHGPGMRTLEALAEILRERHNDRQAPTSTLDA